MRRTVAALLLITACAGTPQAATTTLPPTTTPTSTINPPTTTTTPDQAVIDALEHEADADLIVQLWRDYSDSWAGGADAGFQFMADNIHPAEGCTKEELQDYYIWPDGTSDEVVAMRDTIQRDDGWTISGGEGDGQVPEGRIYTLQIQGSNSIPGEGTEEYVAEIHTSIVDGRPLFFFACE